MKPISTTQYGIRKRKLIILPQSIPIIDLSREIACGYPMIASKINIASSYLKPVG